MIAAASRLKINPVLAKALGECKPHFVNAALFSCFINLLQLGADALHASGLQPRGDHGRHFDARLPDPDPGLRPGYDVFLDSLRTRLLMRSGLRVDKILAGEVLDHLYARTPIGRQGPGSMLLREFDTFKQTLSGAGIVALFDLPWIVIFLGLCFYLNVWLGCLTIGGGAILAFVTWLSERSSYKYVTQSAEAMAKAYGRQDATAQRSDVVRALGMRRSLVAGMLKERHGALDEQIKASWSVGGFSTFSKFLRQFLQSVALGVGAYLAIHQMISAGAIFAASLLMSRALNPMEQVSGQWRSLIRGYNAFKTVNKALDERDAKPQLTRLAGTQGGDRCRKPVDHHAGAEGLYPARYQLPRPSG